MSDQLQIPGQDADVDADGPWPGGLGHGAFARSEGEYENEDPAGSGPGPSKRLVFAGLVLAVLIWPAGLVLSVIGLVTSRGRGGPGRMFAIFGLVVSLVFAVITGVVVDKVLTSTAADPGCAAVESPTVSSDLAKLVHDDNILDQDENAATANQATITAAVSAYISDLKTYQGELDHAVAVSVHASVKNAISTMDQNVGVVLAGYQALQANDSSQGTQAMAASARLPANASAIDNLCTSL